MMKILFKAADNDDEECSHVTTVDGNLSQQQEAALEKWTIFLVVLLFFTTSELPFSQ